MAEHFIQGAIKNPGSFSKAAKAAGMTTSAYAAHVLKKGSTADATTKKRARLAQTLAHMHSEQYADNYAIQQQDAVAGQLSIGTVTDDLLDSSAHGDYIYHTHLHNDGTVHSHPHQHEDGTYDHEGTEHGDLPIQGSQQNAEPDTTDLHVNAPVNSEKKGKSRSSEFLNRIYTNVVGTVKKKGALSPDDFQAAVRSAAGGAGGVMAHAPKPSADVLAENEVPEGAPAELGGALSSDPYMAAVRVVGSENHLDVLDFTELASYTHDGASAQYYGELADLCSFSQDDAGNRISPDTRLVLPVQFVEPPEWIPYLPKPGIHQHAKFGTVVITKERNQRFMDNFHNGVYQTQIPIDAEHATKVSGALGWIGKMRMNDNGSVDAQTSWTPRGKKMLKSDSFKYFSPEFFDKWQDPADESSNYRDIAIGGALVTRPFFKEKSLRSLVASEDGVQIIDLTPSKEGLPMSDTAEEIKAAEALKASEELAKTQAAQKYSEDQAELQKFREENKAFAEKIATLERSGRTQRFSAEVYGRSDDNQTRWFGEPEKKVSMLESLSEKFGEDSDEFKEYVSDQRAYAAQLKHSSLFKEHGRTGAGSGQSNGGSSKFGEMVNARVAEKGISMIDAMSELATEQPEMYEHHRRSATVISKAEPDDD